MSREVNCVVARCLATAGEDVIAYGSALFPYLVKHDRVQYGRRFVYGEQSASDVRHPPTREARRVTDAISRRRYT
jgi:hypothetical protein